MLNIRQTACSAVTLVASALISAAALGAAPEPLAIHFHGQIAKSACTVTVGSGRNDTIELGNVSIGADGRQVPVDLYFSNCSARALHSFKWVGADSNPDDGMLGAVESGLVPTNLERVKVKLFVNEKGKPGHLLPANRNVIGRSPVAVKAQGPDFVWRPMWAQLAARDNQVVGEVTATAYFELKYE